MLEYSLVVANLKGIIVFDEAGIRQASVGLENIRMNQELFGSFMSAIQTYAEKSIGSEMKGLTYSSVRLVMGRAGENYVVTLHSVDDPDADWNHRATLRIVEGDGFRLNNQYLEILTELLTEEKLSVDEAETLARMKRNNSA
ncbi:MAG: hypothetical protein ACXACG_01940 [Candidatus Thorarchaeota archaeon]|jgi:hypothetical protein